MLVVLNQIRSVDRQRLIKRLGRATSETMQRVDQAIQISLGLRQSMSAEPHACSGLKWGIVPSTVRGPGARADPHARLKLTFAFADPNNRN